MKKMLYLFPLLVLLFAVLFSCRNDYLAENEARNQSELAGLNSKIISLNESAHKNRIIPELKLAKENLAKKSVNIFGKVVNIGDVTIETESVIYIENGPNFHTYTFNIVRSNPLPTDPVENLLLSLLADGSYQEFLVSYNLTDQEKQKLENGQPVDTKGKTTITELAAGTMNIGSQLAKSSMVCGWTSSIVYVSCKGGAHNESNFNVTANVFANWANCENPATADQPSFYINFSYGCKEVVESFVPSEGGGGETGGGGGEGGPGDPPTDPCTTAATNPGDVGIVDGNGCNVGVPTQPNVGGENDESNCGQLESLSKKQYFKDDMQILKDNVDTGTREKGFVLHASKTTPISPILIGSTDNDNNAIDYGFYYSTLSDNLASSIYGNGHNHLKNDSTHVGIFPPHDLNSLALFGTMEINPASPNYSPVPKKAVTYVITDKGFFALKISDLAKLQAFAVDYASWSKEKLDDYMTRTFQNKKEYNIRHESTHDELITGFLRLIHDKDIGIELYEGNKSTFNNWKKLQLIDNGNGNYSFSESPCNL